MAIDSISPVMSAAPLQNLSRPPETTANAREAAAQENDARTVARSVSGASPAAAGNPEQAPGPVQTGTIVQVPASPDAETTLRQSSAEIARASSGQDTGAAQRTASEAYQAQANAQQDIARQQQGNGATSIDVMA